MIFLATLVFLISVGLVLYPLWRRQADAIFEPEDPLEDLRLHRDMSYSAIMELDFDYEIGNLSSADYQKLREEYRDKAAAILKEMDRHQQDIPKMIEAAVMKARKRKGLYCPSCGALSERGARFCSQCGTRLRR